MPTSLQKSLDAWRDAIFAAMTPRQRALLKSGHRVHVRIGDTKYLVCPANHPSEKNLTEIPIRFT